MPPCVENLLWSSPSGQASLMRWRGLRGAFALLSLLLLASFCTAASARLPKARTQSPAQVPVAGEAIYLNGKLSTSAPLRGARNYAPDVEGAAAACVNCHRRSGLGELEGPVLVPPVTARYLYRARGRDWSGNLENAALTMAEPGTRPELLSQAERSAYTDATLARAIREGIGADGRTLDYLMPRYRIDDADMASLIAYLKQLSRRPSPGVADDTLQFATVVTPDADPVKRHGMLDVLERFFGKQNVFSAGKSPSLQPSHRFITNTSRRWQLHVWELTGAPQSWKAQLEERLKREPVFAVVSGAGGRTWAPVHEFCEQSHLPCLFPNVDLPVDAEQDFYDVYLSKGVLLEAELIAGWLRHPGKTDAPEAAARRRLVQVYRHGDIGEDAAAELRRAPRPPAVEIVDHALEADADSSRVQDAALDVGPGDILVLWLRPGDIRSLPERPPGAAGIFVSGIMAGLERAPLALAWRRVARMTYPFDLPDLRRVRMDYPLGWMRFKQVPVIEERTQTDTFLACLVTAETISLVGEDLVRDHLLETLEMHLGTRLVNGYYPRLGLAAGQRFASKGGYLVRFADDDGASVVADGDWNVP
jgi:hypothetical protein